MKTNNGRFNPSGRIGRHGLAFFSGFVSALFVYFQILFPFSTIIYDELIRAFPTESRQDIVIVGVDQYSIDNIGAWPWQRDVLAKVINQIQATNPRSVGIDLILDQSRDLAIDLQLADVLSRYDNIVLPVIVEQYQSNSQLVEILPNQTFMRNASKIGHVVRELDEDGVLRFVYLTAGLGSPHWSSMALEMSKQDIKVDDILANTLTKQHVTDNLLFWRQNNMGYLPFTAPDASFDQVSFYDVLRGYQYDFKDKYVLIGTTALGLGDTLVTPMSSRNRPISGVEVVANELQAILDNNLISPVNRLYQAIVAFILLMTVTFCFTSINPRAAVVLGISAFGFILIGHGLALLVFKVYWPVAELLFMLVLGYMLSSWQRLSYIVKKTHQELQVLTYQKQGAKVNHGLLAKHKDEEGVRFLYYLTQNSGQAARQSIRKIKSIMHDDSLDDYARHEFVSQIITKSETLNILGKSFVLSVLFSNDKDNLTSRANLPSYDLFIQQFELLHEFHDKAHLLKDFMQKAFNEIESGIVIANGQGVSLVVNERLRNMLQLSETESIDYIEELLTELPMPEEQDWATTLSQILFAEASAQFESVLNGLPVMVYVTSYVDRRINQTYLIINVTDISMIKKSQAQKEMFSSFLAHDLRSPLTSILAACELTKLDSYEEGDKNQLKERIEMIEKNANKTLGYTNQLLNLSYAEGLSKEKMAYGCLLDILNSALTSNHPLAESKQIKLVLHMKIDDEDELLCNSDMLERAITNIINNAVKYSPSETTINVSIEKLDKNYLIRIQDEGDGISAENIEHIFEMYKRTSKSVDAERGMGLGLTFVKTVIEKHGGKIKIDSQENIGTQVTLEFPIRVHEIAYQ